LPNGDLAIRRGGQRDGEIVGLMPQDGFYFDRTEKYPGATHPELATWEPPRWDAATLEFLALQAEALFRGTDRAIVVPCGPPYELFNGLGQGGFEDWMVTFASEPEYVRALYAKLVDAWLANLRGLHAAVGERVQVLQIADDFGTQRAPFLSLRSFRELVMPAYKRGLDWVHAHTNWKVMLHSDGAIRPLLPAIIEMGVDILNPVQTTAAGMEAGPLKAEFGRDLVFWGGACDPQTTLTFGSPEQVREETRRNVEILAHGSGYVFAPVHNVQATVPPENILALFRSALRA
jgi:uroporphyrinogen decarboxylase